MRVLDARVQVLGDRNHITPLIGRATACPVDDEAVRRRVLIAEPEHFVIVDEVRHDADIGFYACTGRNIGDDGGRVVSPLRAFPRPRLERVSERKLRQQHDGNRDGDGDTMLCVAAQERPVAGCGALDAVKEHRKGDGHEHRAVVPVWTPISFVRGEKAPCQRGEHDHRERGAQQEPCRGCQQQEHRVSFGVGKPRVWVREESARRSVGTVCPGTIGVQQGQHDEDGNREPCNAPQCEPQSANRALQVSDDETDHQHGEAQVFLHENQGRCPQHRGPVTLFYDGAGGPGEQRNRECDFVKLRFDRVLQTPAEAEGESEEGAADAGVEDAGGDRGEHASGNTKAERLNDEKRKRVREDREDRGQHREERVEVITEEVEAITLHADDWFLPLRILLQQLREDAEIPRLHRNLVPLPCGIPNVGGGHEGRHRQRRNPRQESAGTRGDRLGLGRRGHAGISRCGDPGTRTSRCRRRRGTIRSAGERARARACARSARPSPPSGR
uniref:Ig-like domain-containing protein n=1 Tax=Parastrongyloides trichosuri TaxID=131310 RepID=A0A0N4ZIW2_PARTI